MSERRKDQVPGMPEAICHACGLGYRCHDKDCPNTRAAPPPWMPSPAKAGCICPPTSEQTCMSFDCPRRRGVAVTTCGK